MMALLQWEGADLSTTSSCLRHCLLGRTCLWMYKVRISLPLFRRRPSKAHQYTVSNTLDTLFTFTLLRYVEDYYGDSTQKKD